MDTTPTREWVQGQFNRVLGVDPSSVDPSMRVVDDLGADSIDVVEIVTAAERDFGVVIDEEDIYEVSTVGDIIELLDRMRAA